ncbi:MAG: PIG-L family deacetylase [Puniceicoccaceae bacterium]|nr:MAG: PIG-L family deacetylase [Puniceicoccaceae bacterium]
MAEAEALARTTHLGIGAHQDDLEFMAAAAILECHRKREWKFGGITVTDGRGSARAGPYQDFDDEEMRRIRRQEQRKAAVVGDYAFMAQLDYASREVKRADREDLVADLEELLRKSRPRVVLTHQPADKHDTHIGVLLGVLAALRRLPAAERPEKLYGCEVWRGLDWLPDEDKTVFPIRGSENLLAALMGVFDSQIAGGKGYDKATAGRKLANATYFASHAVDDAPMLEIALDLTPLMHDPDLSPASFIDGYIDRFRADVADRLQRLGS